MPEELIGTFRAALDKFAIIKLAFVFEEGIAG
jgi:hypothetical protein